MLGTKSPFRRFWETDRGLSVLLFVLLALVFVAPVAGLSGRFGRAVVDVLFTLLIVAGLVTISRQRVARVVGTIAVLGLVARWIGSFAPGPRLDIAIEVSGFVSVVLLSVVVFTQVFRTGSVSRHRILGAIAVYLLLGVAWGAAYQVVALISSDAFATMHGALLGRKELLYYSFVTLTTVGYGDVTPVSPVARSLAILEALTGQLYLAVLLARLVALEVGSAMGRRDGGSGS